jgi:hypothetical protein
MASARNLPISASPLAEMAPTWAISSLDDLLRVFLQVLNDGRDGKINAALQIHRVHARGDRFGALSHNRVGEDGRGGGAITCLV